LTCLVYTRKRVLLSGVASAGSRREKDLWQDRDTFYCQTNKKRLEKTMDGQ